MGAHFYSNQARSRPTEKFMQTTHYQFDPIDKEYLRLMGRLGAGKRLLAMVDAHELVYGLIRGRLRRRHPDLSALEMSQMLLQEIARADARRP